MTPLIQGTYEKFMGLYLATNPIAMDTETTADGTAFVASVAFDGHDGHMHSFTLTPTDALSIIAAVKPGPFVFHNAKFDIQAIWKACLTRPNLSIQLFDDTEIMAHLTNEHDRKGLKYLARTILGIDTKEEDALKEWMRKNKHKRGMGYENIDPDVLVPYAVKDAEYTLALYKYYLPLIENASPQLQSMYNKDKEVCLAVTDIEMSMMGLDQKYINDKYKEYNGKLLDVLDYLRRITQDDEFNPASPKQVREVLADRGIVVSSTGEQFLLPHVGFDPFVDALLEYRRLHKLTNTYLANLNQVATTSKFFQPNFRLNKTVTGRMAGGGVEEL